MSQSTWRELLTSEMEEYGETLENIVAECGLDLDSIFDDGYGSSEGKPFTVWTHDRVYFPAVYDGAECVASVPRNPCHVATSHIGGE